MAKTTKKKSQQLKMSFEDFKANESVATVQPITETLEKNYMPYAMSVIVSRALPEIDGFKPSHRKLLYTMYKMGLMTGQKTKSANIVGQTMRLNPHGDASIYETMVRLTRGNESLLHPFIDSKGSFGKQYSRDMAYAAARYTEAKLDPFCHELFDGIDKNSVDFVPNYDNTTTEPTLLPTTFPNILVSPNLGIAVGMMCSICSFNLSEICDGTIALLKNPNTTVDRLLELVKGPDFPGGAQILYDREAMKKVYETGLGSIRVRAKYEYNKAGHSIDILEIPYSSSIEAIMKKITDLIKTGKMKEITDVRDAIDLGGFKLTLDLKRDADPHLVMKKLFTVSELERNEDCNFNILVDGTPRLMGVKSILLEWIRFRSECLSRELRFDLGKKQEKLHLLTGLAAILLDIDKAIRIIRNTEAEEDVVPNLAKGFSLTTVQAEYIAEIKLRNLNRQYILNRVKEIESLTAAIKELEEILRDELKLKALIIEQLKGIKAKYGKPRKTEIIYDAESSKTVDTEELFFQDYACRLVLTHGGYFKKLSAQAMRGTDEQKLKEGDFVIYEEDSDNRGEVLFFTDRGQMYRARTSIFDLCKKGQMGDYIPTKLEMDDDEHVIGCQVIHELVPEDRMIYVFANGKAVRVPMSAYETKSRRRKLSGACSTASTPIAAIYEKAKTPVQIFMRSAQGKGILIKSTLISEKSTRTASGTQIFQLKGKDTLQIATANIEPLGPDVQKCRKIVVPAVGVPLGKTGIKDLG